MNEDLVCRVNIMDPDLLVAFRGILHHLDRIEIKSIFSEPVIICQGVSRIHPNLGLALLVPARMHACCTIM